MRTTVLITGLLLLLAANLLMMYVSPFGLMREGFDASGNPLASIYSIDSSGNKMTMNGFSNKVEGFAHSDFSFDSSGNKIKNQVEGFSTYSLASGGGAKDAYEPMGAFDNVRLSTGNPSAWRYTAPNEPLKGPAFKVGADDLFMFKNNQCKPECCGASFSCDGGCVCTTPEQRDLINQRGGNRTQPDDGF